jgi:ribosomal protein S19
MTKYIDPIIRLREKDYTYKYVNIDLFKSVIAYNADRKKLYKIQTKSRSSTITPLFKNLIVHVYNGKKYIPFKVNKDIIGHKFGEFIYTRRNVVHKKQGKKLTIKKKKASEKKKVEHFRVIQNISSLYLQKKVLKELNEKKNKS